MPFHTPRSFAFIALLGGIPALPFLDDLLDELEKFFGGPFGAVMHKTMREAIAERSISLNVAGV
jgi:hypothetical protein